MWSKLGERMQRVSVRPDESHEGIFPELKISMVWSSRKNGGEYLA